MIKNTNTIPEGAVEIQTGLYLHEHTRTIGSTEYTFRELYSSEGYCFYDLADEYYDEEGNLIPNDEVQPSQRVYYQWMSLAIDFSSWTYEQLNSQFISVPVDPTYEIVSRPNDTVVA